MDEYGRRPWQRNYENPRQREKEWQTFEAGKREWAKKRLGKSRSRTDERLDGASDSLIDRFLREEGLIEMSHPADAEDVGS